MHINIIIPRDFLYLVDLFLCPGLDFLCGFYLTLLPFFSVATGNMIKTWVKEASNFQIAKFQLQGFA